MRVLRLDPHELDSGSGGHAPPLPDRLVVEGARFLLGPGSGVRLIDCCVTQPQA